MAARRMASATTLPPNSGALNPESPPWNLPIGVRTADRITAVSTAHLQSSIIAGRTTRENSALRCERSPRFSTGRLVLALGQRQAGAPECGAGSLLPHTVFVRGNAAPPLFASVGRLAVSR